MYIYSIYSTYVCFEKVMAVQFSANLDLSDANLLGLRLWYRYDQIHALGN